MATLYMPARKNFFRTFSAELRKNSLNGGKPNFKNAVISTFLRVLIPIKTQKNHPYGDRTRNSALRGRRLNQFDQRAMTTLNSILSF